MAVQEMLGQNLVNTTSIISVQSNTATADNLFDRNPDLKYTSSGYDTSTATVLTFSFSSSVVVSTLLLQNHNFQNFRIFYDGVTANSLHATTTNSATNTYIDFASVTVASISIQVDTVFTAGGGEKSIGEFVVANKRLEFERNPSFRDFVPELAPKQIVHNMPDGGVSVYWIRDKYQASIGWQFITPTFKDQLEGIFTAHLPFYFVPKPTTTAWDGRAYECSWIGNFGFRPSSNDEVQGYGGKFVIRQTYGA